ncbi:AAA family ATPase [Bacillus sp. SD088]|uniref:AAA family ATPase n=1 Tax=Bacillus sp. SD088 TaxID=2782012 RepID=UPI001A979A25|nr:AAA family ATPase [Bacillus sp. SD088]MBO0993610.1 AAA family ATPase [Bacillus sp. SD088]
MKIKSLYIYGYGKFTEFAWNSVGSMQVVYGYNEAGKSTIMAFIHSILFGFPSKQSSQLRYEPKYSHAYGGRLVVETKIDGEVVIERVKGKAGGEVRIQFKDGTIGGEEQLLSLLAGMNKALYQNLFSFDLKGIQEVQRLQGTEIGRYLLAAGTFGTDQLLSIEEELKKESEQLFKPNGRKPKLNQLLQQLKESEQELRKAKQQNKNYDSLLLKKDHLEQKHDKLETELKEKANTVQNVTTVLEKWPILQENHSIDQRLKELGLIEFPVDGLKRYENYLDKQIFLRTQIEAIVGKLEKTEQILSESKPSPAFQTVVHRADKLIQEWPLFLQNREDMTENKREIEENKGRIAEIEQALGLHVQAESLDLGITVKEQVREELNEQLKLQLRTEDITKQLEKVSFKFAEMEAQCQSIEESLWSETDFKQLEQERNAWIEIEEQLYEKKRQSGNSQQLHKGKKQGKYRRIGEGVLFSLSFVLFVWAIVSTQWLLSLFSGAVCGYLLFIIFLANKGKTSSDEHLSVQIQELTAELEKREKNYHPKVVYEEQVELRNEWKRMYQIVEQTEQAEQDLLGQEQQIKTYLARNKEQIQAYKESIGLPIDFPDFRLEDAMDLLSEREDRKKNIEKLKSHLQEKHDRQMKWLQELEHIASIAGCTREDPSETLFSIKQKLKLEEEKVIRQNEWKVKKEELESERIALEREYKEYHDLLSELQKKAGTADEEQYRAKAEKNEEMHQLHARQQILQDQLNQSVKDYFSLYASQDEIKQEHTQLLMSIEAIERSLENIRQEVAALDHQIAMLEEGGTYTEKLHRFYQIQSIFQDEAMNWAKVNMAISLLQKTMNNYILDRFPKVVQKAREYFAFLTDGEYLSLYYQENDQLNVERKDGALMEPVELSQGTKEQLYIALRFALVFVIQEDYRFPIIIDDGFVNFDKNRTKKICTLIQTISKDNQVLLFTCHEHIRELFSRDRVFMLPTNHDQSSKSGKSHSMI